MRHLKIGDKLRVIRGNGSFYHQGDILEIVAIQPTDRDNNLEEHYLFTSKFRENKSSADGASLAFFKAYCELIPGPESIHRINLLEV